MHPASDRQSVVFLRTFDVAGFVRFGLGTARDKRPAHDQGAAFTAARSSYGRDDRDMSRRDQSPGR